MMEKATVTGSMEETSLLLGEKLGADLDDLTIEWVTAGVFFTGVTLSSGHTGMAFTPIGEMPEAVCCPRSASRMPMAGKLSGIAAGELLDWAHDGNVLKAAIGIALLNALSHYLCDRDGTPGYEISTGVDAVEGMSIDPHGKVVLVGALVPYIRMLKEKGCTFSILEKSPEPLKGDELDYYVPPTGAREALSHADLVIATGATMVNGSLDQLIEWTPEGSRIVVVGPTASMIPQALFRRGVERLGGVRITDPPTAMQIISEGGSGYHMFGKCAEKIVISKNSIS